jgi:hypothetical protein
MGNCSKYVLALCLLGMFTGVKAQKTTTPKVVLITIDGFRWQELFTGADSLLVAHKDYVQDADYVKKTFWRDSPVKRRKALMPFLWGAVPKMGQLYGNRLLGNKMDLTNTKLYSYPGYNEILTGKADDVRITGNAKIPNPNTTIFELFNASEEGKGKVAAFGSWDVFPYIINEERSGVYVNAGFDSVEEKSTEREKFLNQLQGQIPSPWSSVRLDAFTHHYALEYMKKEHPSLVYIAYGETDDFAHDGDYQAYLKAAHNTDALIKELWEFTQQDHFYKDNTVFIITTDHGRGSTPINTWRDHGGHIKGAAQVWLAAFGKGVSPKGELSINEQLYSNQVAPTVMNLLNLSSTSIKTMGKAIDF